MVSAARATERVSNVKKHESEYIAIAYGMDTNREFNLKTPPTLAEDNAFMKKVILKDISKEELRKIYRIAQDGLNVRSNVDKAIADIRRHEAEKIATGVINNGLKFSEIYKRARELLRGLQG